MRKFMLAFLTFLIVMPSLACAMPMCKSEAAETQPCHSTSHERQSETENSDQFMLLLDCMSVDLFAQDAINNDFQPDQTLDTLNFAWADLTTAYDFDLKPSNGVRGLPPTDNNRSPSRPLYLTTQRFRL